MPVKLLDRWLALCVQSYRKQDGEDFQVGCIQSNTSALRLYLNDKCVNITLLGVMQETVECKCKELKAKGYGHRPNAVEYITPDMEEKMWDSSVFGAETPKKLIYTLVFFI